MASNKKCVVNRTQDNQIESVLVRNPSPVYYQIIGEQGASNLDKMEEATTKESNNYKSSVLDYLGNPEIINIEDGELHSFRTEDGLMAGVMTTPSNFRIDGINALELGKGQGTKMFNALIEYLKYRGVETISTISAGEGAVKMHNRAVENGLLRKISEEGREGLFEIVYDNKSEQAQTIGTKETNLSAFTDTVLGDLMGERELDVEGNIENRRTDFQIIGEQGASNLDKMEEASTRLDNLSIAREMETSGKSDKEIRLATGWEKGADGKWRYEISDVKIIDNVVYDGIARDTVKVRSFGEWLGITRKDHNPDYLLTLGRFAQSADLIKTAKKRGIDLSMIFEAYPQLKNIKLTSHKPNQNNAKGFLQSENNLFETENKPLLISIREDINPSEANSILIHEIQHAVQEYEGFASGGNIQSTTNLSNEEIQQVSQVEKAIKDAQNLKNSGEWVYESSSLSEIISTDSSIPSEIKNWAINIVNSGQKEIDFFLNETPLRKYQRLAGEIEARNVQTRANMSMAERRATLLSETEDVAREDQIILFQSMGISESNSGSSINKKAMPDFESGNQRFTPLTIEAFQNLIDRLQKAFPGFAKVTYDFEAFKKQAEKLGATLNDIQRMVMAFHGSPHSFDKFTTDKIGTGEGAQAFGWGLYFTDLEDIARNYASKLSKRKHIYPTIPSKMADDLNELGVRGSSLSDKETLLDNIKSRLRRLKSDIYDFENGSLEEDFKDLKDDWHELKEFYSENYKFSKHSEKYQKISDLYTENFTLDDFIKIQNLHNEIFQEDITQLEEFKGYIENLPEKQKPTRVLYNVTLHKGKQPSEYTWLEWDKNINNNLKEILFNSASEQSLSGDIHNIEISEKFDADSFDGGKTYRVGDTSKMGEKDEFTETIYSNLQDALLEATRLNFLDTTIKGREFYEALAKKMGQQQASLFLLENGIDGIKYPAESISIGATSDNARGFNYVVFDENAVTIEDKIQFMQTPNGTIYGAKLPDGTIYLNQGFLNANTPIHEFSHLFEQLLPSRFKKGIELLKQTDLGKKLFEQLKQEGNYVNLTDEQLWGEALNTHIGNFGENEVNNPKGKLKQLQDWIKDFFAKVGDVLGIKKLSPDTQLRMFTEGVVKDLLGGKPIVAENQVLPSEQVQYSFLTENDYDANGNIKPEVLAEIQAEREAIKAEAQANGTFMKAPNGKPTNLNEAQWIDVRTKRFKDWFGDWLNDPENASKVVDDNGEPLVVYHGTNNNFTEFTNKQGIRGGAVTYKVDSKLHFFSENKYYAENAANVRTENFGGKKNIKEVFLNIRNLEDWSEITEDIDYKVKAEKGSFLYEFGIDKNSKLWLLFEGDEWDMTQSLINNNKDGIKLIEDTGDNTYAVFSPNQIKSATENLGTYSNKTGRIDFQIIGEQGVQNLSDVENIMVNNKITKEMEEAGKNAKTNFIQSELYQNIKQQPFITSEQALDVYKSIYSDSILPTWENGTENGTPLTQEPMLTYRTDSGLITSNLSEALKNSSNFFETGFMNSKNEFESKIETPIYSRTTFEGQIQTAIKNDYLLPIQIAPNTYEAVDSMAAEVFNQELLVTNYNGFKRNGDTFEFGDFKPTLEKGTPRNIELQSRAADTYRELQSKGSKPKPTNYSKTELSNMIQSWMKKIGFSFTTIEAYKNNYKIKFGVEPDAQALIDLNNKVVAFLDGKITLDVLAEEFSHLIIEAWDQSEIQRMLQTVQNTREYAEHAQVYREAYSKQISDSNELEQAVRKEVLGKMLANSLQQNFSLENRTETERNFFNRLSQILDQVINFIKSKLTNNLRNDIDMMSREIANLLYNEQLDSRLDLDRISGANVMYSLGNVGGSNYQSFLNKQSGSVKELMRDLNRGKKSLTNEATTALTAFQNALGTADSCIIALEEHSEKGEVKSAELNSLIQATLLQDPLLRQLRSYAMKNDTDFYNKYKDVMSATLDKLAELEGLNSNIEETKDPETVLEEMSNKYADVSEKDLDEVKESLRGVNRDTGWLGKHFLHMGKTGNSIVNMLTMVVNDLVNKTRSEFMKDAREFGDKLLSKKDQLLNFVSGRYFKSKVDQEAIIRDKFQYELDILKKIYPDTYANKTLEQYLEEFPNGNRPATSSDNALYYKFEYEYRKNLSEQKWESESRRKYQKDFIDRLESIFPGRDVSETLLFKNLINYENSSRKTNYINKRAIRKILLEGRREDTNPYLSGEVKQGLTPMFYYQAKIAVQEGKVDVSNVVSTNPNFELFKDGAKQPKDSDLVFVFSEEDSNSAGQLAFAYMKWNNLSLIEANKNKTDGSVLKENFEVEYKRKLNELALKNLSKQEFDKQLRDWLSDALLFEATDEYWESFGEANFGIQFDLFREKGRMDDRLKMRNYEQEYKELQIQKQQILKKYKQQNDYKEIDVKSISTADKTQMTLIEAQQKALRDDISKLFAISELDMYPPSLDSDSTIRLNQSFHELFREFIGKGFNEASTDELIKFFTNSDLGLNFEKSTALKKLRDDLKREKTNDFIREQKAYAESLGLDSSNQTDVLRAYLTKNAPLWYRRYDANTAYDGFLKDYNAGNLNTQELVKHFLEGNNNPIIYKGKPLTMMQVSLAFKFTLPQEESLQDLISLYKAETNNQNKVKILDRMQGVDGVDEKYLVDISDITGNTENLQTYIDVMDAQIRRLEKFDSLTKDNLFLRPQYRKTSYERTEAFVKSQGKKQQLKDWFKETFTFTKDDMEDSFRKQVEEVSQKIPKYGFYKLTEAELTEDVFYSIMKGLEDANHYEQRKSHFQDATSLVQALNGLEFKNGKRPTDTNYYKMMQESMDFNFFGKTVTSRLEFEAMGQTFDLTKFVFGIKNMSVKFALAFSPIVAMTNVSAGITQNAIMRAVGRNIYSKSNDRALGVMTKLLPESLKDIGSFDPQSKVNKILYNFGIYNMADRYRNSKFNKTLRLLPETSFGLMAIGNFGLEGQTTLAKLMDIRLIDGKFVDWRRYSTRQKTIGGKTNSEIKSEFDVHSDKSMYDYIQDDGTFNLEKLKADGYNGDIEKDQSLAMTQIRSLAELTTMEIAKHHEGFGARDPWVSFILSLKKWLVLAMSTNFSGKRYDFELNGQEEGLLYSPKYVFKLLKSYFKDGVAINEAWDQLDEYQQKNIKTSSIIAGLMIGMIGVAGLIRAEAGEPENEEFYTLQLLNYVMLRNLNETFSSSIGVVPAIVESLQSPVMAISSAKAMGSIFNPENFTGATVKSGKYQGMSRLSSSIVKATFLKNLYGVSSSDAISQSAQSYLHFNQESSFLHILNFVPEPEE